MSWILINNDFQKARFLIGLLTLLFSLIFLAFNAKRMDKQKFKTFIIGLIIGILFTFGALENIGFAPIAPIVQ